MIAEWYDLRETLLYRWFNEMEEKPLMEAIHDDKPPGRESKITEEEHEQFVTVLQNPPNKVGYDAPAWTSKLAQDYLKREFGVEYTLRHIR